MEKIKIEQTLPGGLWFAAWLFTIGLIKATLLEAIVCIIIWPYYLGAFFGMLV